MRPIVRLVLLAALVVLPATARADDLRGADRFLCTAVSATACWEDGECIADLPWNLNVPQFVEVDLKTKRLATTKASGENRATTVEYLRREGGMIVLQGMEGGRAFSFMITEETGMMTVAVAREGRAVSVFGACTPAAASN